MPRLRLQSFPLQRFRSATAFQFSCRENQEDSVEPLITFGVQNFHTIAPHSGWEETGQGLCQVQKHLYDGEEGQGHQERGGRGGTAGVIFLAD